jgi:mRNA interferase RelE/StbE
MAISARSFCRRFKGDALEALGDEPRPAGCKKLKGGQQERRARVGDYRIVYTIDDAKLRLSVTRIRHRSEVYQG